MTRNELEEKIKDALYGLDLSYGLEKNIVDHLVTVFSEFHTQEAEQAYQRGRIDEAKTCEKAKRHQLTLPAQQEKSDAASL